MKKMKNEQYVALEKIKKDIITLNIKKNNLIKESKKEEETINNFKKSINYWIDQNKQLEIKIYDSQKKIDKLEKDKINKIKNFFISFFSFGRKNKNKKISNLIQDEKSNKKILKQIKLNNQDKIKDLKLDCTKSKEKQTNLITNINETLEKENELLMQLRHLEKVQQQKTGEVNEQMAEQYEAEIFKLTKKIYNLEKQLATRNEENKLLQKKAVIEVNEQMVEQYEAEIFKLTEKICNLENQLATTSNDEGFNSKSTSTSSLYSDITAPLTIKPKPRISKAAAFKKSDKPWEQTLREYDYPPNNCKQKQKTTKILKF